jgi:FkbM family methyltransferase
VTKYVALAKSSVAIARALGPFPTALEWYLRKAKDYVDWRCHKSIACRTKFGSSIRCHLTDLIQRKIAYFGVWEPNLSAYFVRVLHAGDVLADLGANVGYYSLLGSSLVGKTGRVVAVEASPAIFEFLLQNLATCSHGNVRAENCAVAYASGEMQVFSAPSDNVGRSSTVPVEGNILTGSIQAKALHEILSLDELARCRLIKIDIEGAEPPVVKSILENIDLYGRDCEIAVEVSVENGDVLDSFSRAGFNAYLLENVYQDAPYIRGTVKPPIRFTGLLVEQSDFIFSRHDRAFL